MEAGQTLIVLGAGVFVTVLESASDVGGSVANVRGGGFVRLTLTSGEPVSIAVDHICYYAPAPADEALPDSDARVVPGTPAGNSADLRASLEKLQSDPAAERP